MTLPETTAKAEPAEMTLRKAQNWGDTIYRVVLDGVEVGWVTQETSTEYLGNGKWKSAGWAFRLFERDGLKAEKVTSGNSTRRDAIMEGVSYLQIYRLGRVVRFNLETVQDEVVRVDPDRLAALWSKLLDDKYPGVA